jgi:hypothetical protein
VACFASEVEPRGEQVIDLGLVQLSDAGVLARCRVGEDAVFESRHLGRRVAGAAEVLTLPAVLERQLASRADRVNTYKLRPSN